MRLLGVLNAAIALRNNRSAASPPHFSTLAASSLRPPPGFFLGQFAMAVGSSTGPGFWTRGGLPSATSADVTTAEKFASWVNRSGRGIIVPASRMLSCRCGGGLAPGSEKSPPPTNTLLPWMEELRPSKLARSVGSLRPSVGRGRPWRTSVALLGRRESGWRTQQHLPGHGGTSPRRKCFALAGRTAAPVAREMPPRTHQRVKRGSSGSGRKRMMRRRSFSQRRPLSWVVQ